MSEKVRKAIVTMDTVRESFAAYAIVRSEIGYVDTLGHTFDRGPRGKGFAEYNQADTLVRSFDSREEALTYYGRYAEVAREVLAAPKVTVEVDAPEADVQAAESAPETTETPAPAPAPRQRGKAATNA